MFWAVLAWVVVNLLSVPLTLKFSVLPATRALIVVKLTEVPKLPVSSMLTLEIADVRRRTPRAWVVAAGPLPLNTSVPPANPKAWLVTRFVALLA